jgi:hypothetical protein
MEHRNRRLFISAAGAGLVLQLPIRMKVLVATLVCIATTAPNAQQKQPAEATTDWGSTFYALEQKAGRVTTRFEDGYAVAERAMDGRITSKLFDRAGTASGTLHAELTGAMELLDTAGTTRAIRRAGTIIPTLSRANDEAYTLRRGKMNPVKEVEVEFEGGLTAKTIRYPDGYQTALYLYGTNVGRMRYITAEKTLVFKFPGLTEGVFTQDALKVIGGWRFTPTMEWMHVQALGFYQFRMAAKLRAAAQPSWLERAWNVIVPPVAANEPGCDILALVGRDDLPTVL